MIVNGTYVAADGGGFLEKRRRGLVRFANSLVQHPVLSQETLVVMFLTVPTVSRMRIFEVRRLTADTVPGTRCMAKTSTISVQEEFTGKHLPPALEDSLPSTLPDLFDTVRAGVKRSSEVYINLCVLLERLVRRSEGLAADHLRFRPQPCAGDASDPPGEFNSVVASIKLHRLMGLISGPNIRAEHGGTNLKHGITEEDVPPAAPWP